MAEEFLYGSDVVAVFQQVGCEAVPQGVHRCLLGDPRSKERLLERLLKGRWMDVVRRTVRKNGPAVPVALARAHNDNTGLEINVFDANPQPFVQAKPTSLNHFGHEPVSAG